MMRADALRATCVALVVTFAILLLSLSGCKGPDEFGYGWLGGLFTGLFLALVVIPASLRDRRRL